MLPPVHPVYIARGLRGGHESDHQECDMSHPFALGKGLLPPTGEHNAVWCGTAGVGEDNGVCSAEFQVGHVSCFGVTMSAKHETSLVLCHERCILTTDSFVEMCLLSRHLSCFGDIVHFALSHSNATFDLEIEMGHAWAVSS